MAHKNLLNNFLCFTLNNEAYILCYLKLYIEKLFSKFFLLRTSLSTVSEDRLSTIFKHVTHIKKNNLMHKI